MDSSLKRQTITSLLWKLFEQGGAAAITLLVQIVMARLLAPAEFGLLAIMLVFVNVGNVIVQSGLNTAIIQGADVTDDDCSTVFWMCFATSLLLYIAVFIAAPAIADFYQMPLIIWPLRALTLIFFINAYNSIQEAIVARNLQFNKTFRATVTAGVVSGCTGIAAAVFGFGLWALVVQQLMYQLCKCIVLAIQVPWKPRFVMDFSRGRHMVAFGWKLLVSGLLDQGYQSISDLIIGKLFSDVDLGLVSQGKKYPQALGVTLDGAIQPVMLSAVAHVQQSKEEVKRLARRALKTSTFLIVPAMTLFAVVARPLVLILLGEQWLLCVPYLQMYCMVYALLPIHTTNLQVLNGVGRSDLFLCLEVVKVAVSLVILGFTAFVFHDLYAIVAGYVLNGVICTFINAFPSKRVIGYSYLEQLVDICPSFLLSLASGLLVYQLHLLGLAAAPTVLVQIIAMLIVYVAGSWLLRIEAFMYLLRTIKGITIRK